LNHSHYFIYRSYIYIYIYIYIYTECVFVALVIWNAKLIYILYSYVLCVCVCVIYIFSHNLIILASSLCLLYVADASSDVSCFDTWRRKQNFLYDTKCLQSTTCSIGVRRCSVAIYCTGCNCHLEPQVVQDQVTLDRIQRGRYLYTCCR